MSNKNKDNLVIGIDIRNIGKKRTGDEVVFLNLVRNFQFSVSNDVKFEFLLFTDIEDREVLRKIEKKMGIINNDNFKIISLKIPKKGGKFIWNFWTLPIYLRKYPVDIYHTQYITPFFVSQKIKIIAHIHDVSFKVYKQFIKWSDLFFLNILIPLSIRRADKIIAVSKFTKNEIEKYYPQAKGKVDVVYNAVVHNKLKTKELKSYKLQAKYNLPEKYILYIGTLQPRKNVAMLIESYAKIKNKINGIKLVIAGDKNAHNFDKKIDKIIKKYKLSNEEVLFIGFVNSNDKTNVYSLAHILVAPSYYEGFGMTPLEAIEESTPALVSNIPVHKEIYDDAVIYFDLKKLDELKNKLYSICMDESLRTSLIKRGLIRASFFSWKKSAEKMLKIYNSLNQ